MFVRETSRTVRLELEDFGLEAFEELARRERRSPEDVLATAALHLLEGAGTTRLAARVPPFTPETGAASARLVRLSLDEPAWTALEEEAERQRVELGRLLAHAVLFYAGDVATGRA